MCPTASTNTSVRGNNDHTRGSPVNDHQASLAVHPNPAANSACPPNADAATFGHNRG
ncbi:hypothetical protein GCM10027184_21530 [Saccharothrix stipae]